MPKTVLRIIEIQYGETCDEQDIERRTGKNLSIDSVLEV